MSCKLLLVICAVIFVVGSLEAASLRVIQNTDSVVHKLDYEEVKENVVRGARQTHEDDASGEDSDEDDDEDDAEQLQQNIIRQQQAEEQAINDSQEGSDEDDEGDDEEEDDDDDDDSFFGRRLKRDVVESEATNEIQENAKPSVEEDKETTEDDSAATPTAPASPNTSVLILIRDAIKKVTTELPNTQQVATSAQQYFQMFEHFLQQTIEQVIGDDDDESEVESTTVSPVLVAAETADKENETESASPSTDKETAVVVPEQKPETIETSEVVETKV